MPPVLTEPKRWSRPRDPAKTRRSSDLTPEEQAHVRVALRVLRLRLGGYAALAAALEVRPSSLCEMGGSKGKPSAGVAVRVARLAQVPIDDVLSGAWPKAGACPHCGRV